MEKIRLVCIDDNLAVLHALRNQCLRTPDIDCIACLTSVSGFVQSIAQSGADVLVLDLFIPGENTLGIVRGLALADFGPRCVVWTGHDDAVTRAATIRAGASAFVSKWDAIDKVIDAIRVAASRRHNDAPIASALDVGPS